MSRRLLYLLQGGGPREGAGAGVLRSHGTPVGRETAFPHGLASPWLRGGLDTPSAMQSLQRGRRYRSAGTHVIVGQLCTQCRRIGTCPAPTITSTRSSGSLASRWMLLNMRRLRLCHRLVKPSGPGNDMPSATWNAEPTRYAP